ncbi:MAG: MFS transporter [Eubacteriales bacterium]|nr:MFS transporter [Eubacteriales bacterium]
METLQKNRKGNSVFLCCLIAYTVIYVGRVNLSVASPLMIKEGTADVARIGILGSIFSIAYAAGRLLSGRICDRTAPKLVITAGICTAGLANLLMGTAPAYLLMALLWGVNALGQSVLWGSVLNSMGAVYEGSELKKRTALMTTSIPVGNIAGYLLSSYLCAGPGWRTAFYVPGILCILSGIAARVILKDVELKAPAASETAGFGSIRKEIPKQDVYGKLIPAFLHGLIKDNSSFWLPTILAMQYMVKSEVTGLLVVIVPCIGFVGRLAYPAALKAADDDEEKVSLWCFIVTGICSALLITGVGSPVLVSVLIGVIYAATSMINTTFLSVYPIRFADRGCTATISGIMDFLTYLGASAGSAVFGIMASRLGYGSLYVSWTVIAALAVILLLTGRKKCA